jgi:hypothetical protein
MKCIVHKVTTGKIRILITITKSCVYEVKETRGTH